MGAVRRLRQLQQRTVCRQLRRRRDQRVRLRLRRIPRADQRRERHGDSHPGSLGAAVRPRRCSFLVEHVVLHGGDRRRTARAVRHADGESLLGADAARTDNGGSESSGDDGRLWTESTDQHGISWRWRLPRPREGLRQGAARRQRRGRRNRARFGRQLRVRARPARHRAAA